MKKKMYCYMCNKDVEPLIKKEKNKYFVHKDEVIVNEEIFTCPCCKTELFDETLDNSLYIIYNEYLKKFNLSFETIKNIRKSFNLSQELFAKALGWSKRTVIRYENAESLPNKKNLAIYNSIKKNKNEFINILNNNKMSLKKEEYCKIYNLISTDLNLKTINTFLYVLKNNFLSKTQIMKNLFSIDFQFYKENEKSITSLKYAHGTYGPIIDKKDDYLDFLLKHNYIEMVNSEDDIILFKPLKECDLSLFNENEIITMNVVLKKLKNKSATCLTNWSHKFKGWVETKSGQQIDYSYAKNFDLNSNW